MAIGTIAALALGAATIGSAAIGSSAAGRAADAQTQAGELGIAEQRAAREEMRRLLEPYGQGGIPALTEQLNILGLNGDQAQQGAISAQEQSPFFQALAAQGENALLQNASATGGLRGGNIQGALAQFRPQLLNQFIEQQYGRLGGMTALGQQSAAGVATNGLNVASNIGNLLGGIGQAQAGGALAQGQQWGNALGGISGMIASPFGQKTLGKMF